MFKTKYHRIPSIHSVMAWLKNLTELCKLCSENILPHLETSGIHTSKVLCMLIKIPSTNQLEKNHLSCNLGLIVRDLLSRLYYHHLRSYSRTGFSRLPRAGGVDLEVSRELGIKAIRKVQERYKRSYDQVARCSDFTIGDWVVMRFPHLRRCLRKLPLHVSNHSIAWA